MNYSGMVKKIVLGLLFLVIGIASPSMAAQLRDNTAGMVMAPFKKGFNLSDWFNHEEGKYLRKDTYTGKDFKDFRNMGVDVVRLPINFPAFMDSDYRFSEDFLSALDYAVELAISNDMYVILDQHSYYGSRWYPEYGEVLVSSGLRQLAERYRDYADNVVFELFNEPGGNCPEEGWGELQRRLISTIREVDRNHYIIATPYGCTIEKIWDLPVYDDDRLIYTFHLYTPFLFTHQGANWDNIPLQYIPQVPYPYDRDLMPAMPDQFIGNAEYENYYNTYPHQAISDERIRDRVLSAVNWARLHRVPLFVGEFGTLTTVDNEYRCNWYSDVCRIFEENGIAWTAWEYRTRSSDIDFGLFDTAKAKILELGLNQDLLSAMEFNIPDYDTIKTISFYEDYPQSWWTPDYRDGDIDFFSLEKPCGGKHCIKWNITSEFSILSMPIWPVADFSALNAEGARLEFSIRAIKDLSKLNVRFVQYKPDAKWQWRNIVLTGSSSEVPDSYGLRFRGDGEWHKVSVPLSWMWVWGTQGEWKNKPDEGEDGFAWDFVNGLQFAVEGESSLTGETVWLDDIRIVIH